jgi:hypothetical protein
MNEEKDSIVIIDTLIKLPAFLGRACLSWKMVHYEETSSLQVLGTVTADAFVTVFLGLFSFDGSPHDALFPPGLFESRNALAATMLDVLLMLGIRATIAAASVTGAKLCVTPCGVVFAFLLHSSMAIWCDRFAMRNPEIGNNNLLNI